MFRVTAEWEASWHCPECNEYTSSCDEGVNDQNEYFDVVCQECGNQYEAYKD